MQLKILALTDHFTHTKENSIYALLRKMIKHPAAEMVDVVSRGNPANRKFFQDFATNKLFATRVTEEYVYQTTGSQYINKTKIVKIEDYDAIVMRLPRPFEDDFLSYLESVFPDKPIINSPSVIIETSSKEYLLNFPELCPPMKLCKTPEDVRAFASKFPIVLKPLKSYGGKGIVKIENGWVYGESDPVNFKVFLLDLEEIMEEENFLGMQYLENVTQGDKRIVVVNGEVLGASLRLPPENSWLCNVAQGGASEAAEIDADERLIVETLSPKLLEKGIVMFGADTLMGNDGKRVLSEVNTMSIGGLAQIEEQSGRPVLQSTVDLIFDYIENNFNDA